MSFGLNPHYAAYEISRGGFALSLATLTSAVYAQRHWALSTSNNGDPSESEHAIVWKHRIIAVLECIPVLGALTGLVERVIDRYLQRSCHRLLCRNLGELLGTTSWPHRAVHELELEKWNSEGYKRAAAVLMIHSLRLQHTYPSLHLNGLDLTSLPEITLSRLKNLSALHCLNNALSSLSLSNMPYLETVDCSSNRLSSLSLSNMPSLRIVRCSGNRLSSLSFSNLPSLELLDCQLNGIRDQVPVPNPLTMIRADGSEMLRPDVWRNISQLPRNCRVDLSFCGIPSIEKERLERLMQAPGYAGPDIYFGEEPLIQQAPRASLSECLKQLTNHTLDDSLKHIDVSSLSSSGQFEGLLITWLEKMLGAKDFTNAITKSYFATRVLRVLQFALENEVYRGLIESILIEATGTCADRAIVGLHTLELHMELCLAPSATFEHVVHLVRGAYIMGILEDIARATTRKLQNKRLFVDELEIYLGLQVRLRDTFSLPIKTQGMNFFSCSALSDQDIQYTQDEVEQTLTNKSAMVNFFLSQSFWKEKLAQEFSTEKQALYSPFDMRLQDFENQLDEGSYFTAAQSIYAEYNHAEAEWYKAKTLEVLVGSTTLA